MATELQRELVDESRELGRTSAGKEIEGEIRRERKERAAEKRYIERCIEEAKQQHDRATEQLMREERDKHKREMKKLERKSEALQATMEGLLAQRDMQEFEMKKEMKRQRQAYKDDLSRLEKKQRELERQTAALKSHQAHSKEAVQQMSNANAAYPKYSLAIFGTNYAFTGQDRVMSGGHYPAARMGSGSLDACTYGDGGHWVARYTDKRWFQSVNLAQYYPDLAVTIEVKGLSNLELCVLGPAGQQFARWLDGSVCFNASGEVMAKIIEHGRSIQALAFGYQGSSTLVTLAAVMLTGFATAKDCTPGLNYCGHTLYAKGNYDFIIQQCLADNGVADDSSTRNQALFRCRGDPYGYVQYLEYCGRGCVDAGTGQNDYCS
ncbi:hypothetical protein V2A60_006458 [Cordyceps javanica]